DGSVTGVQTCALPIYEVITHRVAIGHTVKDGRAEVVRRWAIPRLLNPAGGLICSASDLLRYARFQLGDGRLAEGGRLLSPASMRSEERRVGEGRGCRR